MERQQFAAAIQGVIQEKADYFRTWTFDEPVWIPADVDADFQRLQRIMVRLVRRFVAEWRLYADIAPVSPDLIPVLEIWEQQPYRVGTYRTDFVLDASGQARIIEITCRFALNGNSSALAFNELARTMCVELGLPPPGPDRSEALVDRLYELFRDVDDIFLLRGRDDRNDSRLLFPVFEAMGIPLHSYSAKEIPDHIHEVSERSLVISELALDEIASLPAGTLRRLAAANTINDYRTAILIHDKRFFAVMGSRRFLESELDEEEIAFFKRFHIPTFSGAQGVDVWADALANKDQWIAKHYALGMSQGLMAGPLATEAEWFEFLGPEPRTEIVLQRWVPGPLVEGLVDGVPQQDFLAGTFMFFDDEYFGLGPFRTSSVPVTNIVDDRKAVGIAHVGCLPEGTPSLLHVGGRAPHS